MSFIGDIFGGGAAKKAAKAQVQAAQMGIDEMRRQFDLNRTDLAPWREAGGAAIGQGYAMLQPGYDHTTSPGYQFRLDEGTRAVENSAASKGMLMSGGTLKDLTRFAQGVAADDYNDQFNRMMAVAGGGQQAATAGAQMGQQTAGGIADLYTQQGNARASGYVGQANALGNTIGQIAQIGAMFAMSEPAAKTKIERIGEWDDRGDGLGKYRFAYKTEPDTIIEGVMADEVETLRPWALGPRLANGYRTVNYGALNAY